MRTGFLRKSMSILFSVLLGPAVLLASTPHRGNGSAPTPNSFNWNFSTEAARILNNLQADSSQVHDLAATLQAYDDESSLIGWRQEGELLQTIRQEVNQMDALEHRLRTIARVTDPGPRAVIRRVVPEIIMLTNATNSEILFLNHHQDELWLPKNSTYANEMYNSSGMIDQYLRIPQVHAAALKPTAQSPKS